MSRYIVTPILGAGHVPYYIVTDTSTGKGVEGGGCMTRLDDHGGQKQIKHEQAHII